MLDVLLAATSANTTTLIVALIVGCSGLLGAVLSPWILSRSNYRHRAEERLARKLEREEDLRHADEVAESLHEEQLRAIEHTDEVARIAREGHEATDGQLKEIHTLVNSNMTAEMQRALDATEGQLVLMKELVRVNKKSGARPSAATLEQIKATEAKVEEMRAAIADRTRATEAKPRKKK